MKKITVIEILTVIIVLVALVIYFAPRFIHNKEDRITAQIKASNAIFTSKIIEEFAHDKNILPSEAAKKTVELLNKSEKNPYAKDKDLYVLDKNQPACANIEYDDNLKMVIITNLDKKGELIARTVISPPSFVTYYKEEKSK